MESVIHPYRLVSEQEMAALYEHLNALASPGVPERRQAVINSLRKMAAGWPSLRAYSSEERDVVGITVAAAQEIDVVDCTVLGECQDGHGLFIQDGVAKATDCPACEREREIEESELEEAHQIEADAKYDQLRDRRDERSAG